jgi:EmrB/QacA subfamily drug resistance transporter
LTTATPRTVSPSQRRRRLALTVIGVAQLLIVLDVTIVNIALPTAQQALHISDGNRQWVVTAYTLAFGGLLLLGGRVADFTGRRRAFVVGLMGFGAASALGGVAPNAGWLFAARGLQGAFAALMAPAALSLLTVTFTEPRERARAFGVFGAVSAGGGAIGLLLGGFLTEYASWRWTLFLSTPVAFVAAWGARRLLAESRATGHTRYDVPGAIVSTVALVMLVYGFSEASSAGWTARVTLALLVGGGLLLAAFVVIELRSSHPLLPMRIVVNGNRGGAYLSRLLIGVAMYGVFLFLTYYLQQERGYSALLTGVAFLPYAGAIVVGAAICSRLLPRFGLRYAMAGGLLLASLGMLLLTRIGLQTSYSSVVLPAELVVGLGLGLTFGPLASVALIGVAVRDFGVAGAMVNTAQQLGGSLGTALLNTIATSAVTSYLTDHSASVGVLAAAAVHSYALVFAVSAALLGGATLSALLLIRVPHGQLG